MTRTAAPPQAKPLPDEAVEGGRLAENILYFARVLRRAGLPVGPAKMLRAVEAVEAVGLGSRRDFYWALHAVLVNRRDQRDIFDQAFHVFWRNPNILEKMMSLVLPMMKGEEAGEKSDLSQRVAEAMAGENRDEDGANAQEETEIQMDMALTFSASERLQKKDFEQMTAAEIAEAKRVIRNLRLPISELPTRRFSPSARGGRADMRRTMRASLRKGLDMIDLKRRKRRMRRPPLVILCDISGSMDRYARMLLHFVHAITNDRDRVHTFLFGTRLTNVTRHMRDKDPDVALAKIGAQVEDWSGGTRIGGCLKEFNRYWSRRVLGQGAQVLLITDGLDRDGASGLSVEIERLHKSCRRLVWLNPLLRWDGFEPRAQGIRALIAQVDDFLPVHNLTSLADLAQAIGRDRVEAQAEMRRWRGLAA